MQIEKIQDRKGKELDMDVYITKRKGFRHINVPKEEGACPLCNEQPEHLKAHHLIPVRLTNGKGWLGELRIHICPKCEEKIHPENQYVEIVRRLIPILSEILGEGGCKALPIFEELEMVARCDTNNLEKKKKVKK